MQVNQIPLTPMMNKDKNSDAADQISQFVENIQLQASRDELSIPASTSPAVDTHGREKDGVNDQMILQAKQFKAAVTPPKGNPFLENDSLNIEHISQLLKNLMENNDDEFFILHVMWNSHCVIRLKPVSWLN